MGERAAEIMVCGLILILPNKCDTIKKMKIVK
jgi:hypothetical protein